MMLIQRLAAMAMKNTRVAGEECGKIGVTIYGCSPPYACVLDPNDVPNPNSADPRRICAKYARSKEPCDNKSTFCIEGFVCEKSPQSNIPHKICVNKSDIALKMGPDLRLNRWRSD
jgi:hypothetical protein